MKTKLFTTCLIAITLLLSFNFASAATRSIRVGSGFFVRIGQLLRIYVTPSSSFSPSDLAGLKLWTKADAIVGLNDGDPVASWVDSSGSGNTVTQSSGSLKPIYKTNILNGKPVVRFDGSDDFMVTPGNSFALQTEFVVFKYTADLSYYGIITGRTSSTIGGVGNSDGNYGFTVMPLTADKICSTNSVASGGSGANSYVGVDGTPAVADDFDNYNTGITYPQGSFHVEDDILTTVSPSGAKYLAYGVDTCCGGGRYLPGDIAEVIIYDSALSSTDRKKVEAYLGTKYNITIAP